MMREDIYRDMEETLGLVPSFMKTIPDEYLEDEWDLFKKLQLRETHIPNKYKELIGLGLSAVTKCRYCTLYHSVAAKVFGATDEEIEEAVHYAKSSAGWSAYLQGMQVDYVQFKDELMRMVDFVKSRSKEGVKASV